MKPTIVRAVQVRATPKFICLSSCAVWSFLVTSDPEGVELYFSQDVDVGVLGAGVRRCIEASRYTTPVVGKELMDQNDAEDRSAKAAHFQMKTYDYKTRRELFLNMSRCLIEKKSNGFIYFSPFKHVGLKSWSDEGIGESDCAKISEAASDRELGEGLRFSLSRCIPLLD